MRIPEDAATRRSAGPDFGLIALKIAPLMLPALHLDRLVEW